MEMMDTVQMYLGARMPVVSEVGGEGESRMAHISLVSTWESAGPLVEMWATEGVGINGGTRRLLHKPSMKFL